MKLPITKRAFVKAGMLRLGEPIAWGSDADLIEEQSELIEELAAALEPFADQDDKSPWCITPNSIRRARAVLAKAKGE